MPSTLTDHELQRFHQATEEEIFQAVLDDPSLLDRLESLHSLLATDRKRSALAYYRTVNPMAAPVHRSVAREIAIVGGNRSSKTETALVECVIRATGHIPLSLRDVYPREKLSPPIRARVVCNSLTDTLEPVIKPKLRWDQWSGAGEPEDGRGHWGWIPQKNLIQGSWEKSYSEKYRTLKILVDEEYLGNHVTVRTRGISTIQFLSYDQELSAFAGSSLHLVVHDELPPQDIYRENRMRTLDTKGTLITAFTPPDETGANRVDVAWFFDDVYERGLDGPLKRPDIDTFILWTEKNQILDRVTIEAITRNLTEAQKQARLFGQFIHLSGVVYPVFARYPSTWCFKCQRKTTGSVSTCPTCVSSDTESFCHVREPFEIPRGWPIVMVIDPHPRKKDAIGWFALTPSDQIILFAELEADGDAGDVARQILDFERRMKITPARRLMDPNIATETNDRLERGWNLRMAYDRVGIRCDLANDSVPMGIQNVNGLLRPDPYLRRPRFEVFTCCPLFIYGMTHWSWDEWTRTQDREPKEIVRERHKDFPDLLRYLANDYPTYRQYQRTTAMKHSRLVPAGGY